MNKIGLYTRVSTEEQARLQDGSLVSQRKRLEEYVEAQNRRQARWGKIFDVYVDEGKSAKNLNRPEFKRLLRDIQSGHVDLVLSTELSRLSRSIRDFCALWDFFKEHKTGFITLREQFDTTTAAGEMMVFNLINFAQFERKQTSERLVANFQSRAHRGLWNGGQVPLGYKRNPNNKGTLLVDENEAQAIKVVSSTFLKTKNLRETCLKLSARGFRTKHYTNKKGEKKGGNHFTVASLHNLLTNATYIGLREINKKRGDTKRVPASWPAIVKPEDFEAVQQILQANRRRYKPEDWKTYSYPLSGNTVCGECGQRLNGKSAHGKHNKHHYYDHSRTLKSNGTGHLHKCQVQRVKAERFEDMVLTSLKTILTTSDIFDRGIRLYQEGQNENLPQIKARIKSLQKSLKDNERRIDNLIDRIAELPKGISAVPIYKKIEELQTKVKDEQAVLDTLQMERIRLDSRDLDESALKARLKRVIERLEHASKAKQREVFSNAIQFVEVHATKLRLGVYASAKESSSSTRGSSSSGSNVVSILSRNGLRDLVGSHTIKIGGEGEIRTHGAREGPPVFKTGAIDHSATSPLP